MDKQTALAQLRKINLEYPGLYREVALSAGQRMIIAYAKKRKKLVSLDLVKKCGISIQNASAQLSALWKKGYLERTETTDPSGGILYVYKPTQGGV